MKGPAGAHVSAIVQKNAILRLKIQYIISIISGKLLCPGGRRIQRGKSTRCRVIIQGEGIMKRGIRIAGLLCAFTFLTGCGASRFSPEVTGVSIDKKGAVTEVVKESFDESIYNKDELESQIDRDVADYNKTYGEKSVKKKSLQVKDGEAVLKMNYASFKDYAQFNSNGFYYGDIKGAVQAGYPFEGSFMPVTDGVVDQNNKVWGSGIMAGPEYSTVVWTEPILVQVPGTICYVSTNVRVIGKSEAVAEIGAPAYVLFTPDKK